MKAIIQNNFFSNFDNIKDHFKKIPLYDLKTYNKNISTKKENWPGKRSYELFKTNPFLFNLIVKEMYDKFGDILPPNVNMSGFVHLRLSEDKKDWIHKDKEWADWSLIVYLSETNLKSGTCLYEKENEEPSATVGFVQNRAFLFNSSILHKSLHNYGDNIENGRLTLNCFITNG